MFIIDGPYVSEFLKETIAKYKIPVLNNEFARKHLKREKTIFWEEDKAIQNIKSGETKQIYTSSENSLQWVADYLPFSKLPKQVNLFKDKLKFRELTSEIFPSIFYKEVFPETLDEISYDELPKPFIIKPAVGFFSLGVFKVSNYEEWVHTKTQILKEIEIIKDVYPDKVLDTTRFIIEENIEGTEYAFDACFNADGEPVVLGIMKHLFLNSKDVSDRVYLTSKEIIKSNLNLFEDFLRKLGTLTDLRNFPLHVELRIKDNGDLLPIEINPLRFGGWCTSADLTYHAYGFNPYLYCHEQKVPDWEKILSEKNDNLNSIIVLNNSTGIGVEHIDSFDYDALLARFENPLELRKADYKEYLIFGFLFAETSKELYSELEFILNSDLREFTSPR